MLIAVDEVPVNTGYWPNVVIVFPSVIVWRTTNTIPIYGTMLIALPPIIRGAIILRYEIVYYRNHRS